MARIRNMEARRAVRHQIAALKAEWAALEEREDSGEFDNLPMEEVDAMFNAIHGQIAALIDREFYLRFPEARNEWFTTVFLPPFGTCEGKTISDRQAQIFRRYLEQDSEDRSGAKYYGRNGANAICLAYFGPKSPAYITIKPIL